MSQGPVWTVRDAAEGDATAIGAFLAERFAATFGHIYASSDLAAFLESVYAPDAMAADLAAVGSAHCLAEIDGALVAVASLGAVGLPIQGRPCESGVELHRLYLADVVKGTGLADALMAWVFKEARGALANALYLGVWSENYRAQRFYARHGFRRAGAYLFPVGKARDLEWILRAEVPPAPCTRA